MQKTDREIAFRKSGKAVKSRVVLKTSLSNFLFAGE
jgi:hypothetical protein